TREGVYVDGSLPEIDDLYTRQARELDPKKREALVHEIQPRQSHGHSAVRAGVHLGRGAARGGGGRRTHRRVRGFGAVRGPAAQEVSPATSLPPGRKEQMGRRWSWPVRWLRWWPG